MDLPHYPINDFGPVMNGMVIGGMGIFHVFLAQFAIGGGLLMCYFQWLAQTGRSSAARRFLDGYFKALVLISFVVGALTGVGMWFTTIQISPRTIGMMVDEFHWLWATEWTFFCLEIVAGYAFYRYAAQLTDRARVTLLVLYSAAAWMSLFWINGILSWQLTPGHWVETGRVWSGFFNPSFWPSLVFRTVVSMTIAALVACVVINTLNGVDREARTELIHRAFLFLSGMALMPFLGIWYLSSIPEDSRSWVLGGSPTMTLFMSIAIGASLLIGVYAAAGILRKRLYINAVSAGMLVALAFGATAGGEFVREGVRKPFTIRHTLLANSIRPEEIAALRETGSVTNDPFPLPHAERYPTEQLALGAKVFRFQCSVCHTENGANGLTHLAGTWTPDQKRLNIAKLQHTKPFMPPFAGNPQELEALVQWIEWFDSGRPGDWPVSADDRTLEQIKRWLDEAGTEPAQQLAQRSAASVHE
jgi:mono/diheme cytochrome c family protein